MDPLCASAPGYAVPTYRPLAGSAWYHFLHGNVPGHQIDFIYRPEVPDGPLVQQHFSHLARLIRYVEPQTNAPFAFSIGNLSRDDVQHEPGHGGVALIFGLRISGVTDHAGRRDPPFAHAIAAIDRTLDDAMLIAAAVAFQRHVLGAHASEEWYRRYVERAYEEPGCVRAMLEGYVGRFVDLPEPTPSAMAPAWVTDGAQQPRRIVIVHDDDAAFGELAVAAARIAAVLYRSDIRWTAISSGREDDIPNGLSVRLVARKNLGPADAAGVVHELRDLPDDAAVLARRLFSAEPVGVEEQRAMRGRPEEPATGHAAEPVSSEDTSVDVNVDVDPPSDELCTPPRATQTPSRAPGAASTQPIASGRPIKPLFWIVVSLVVVVAALLALLARRILSRETVAPPDAVRPAAPVDAPPPTASASPTAPPATASASPTTPAARSSHASPADPASAAPQQRPNARPHRQAGGNHPKPPPAPPAPPSPSAPASDDIFHGPLQK